MRQLPVSVLKNWMFCPRTVYCRQVLGLRPPPTAKMTEGKAAQQTLERLEVRRTLGRYGVSGRERIFQARLSSTELGLSGCADLLLVGQGVAAVVEFKLTSAAPNESHWVQLAAYAALVEEQRGERVDQVLLVRIPDSAVFAKRYHEGWRSRLLAVLTEVRKCVDTGWVPAPAGEQERCADCEYANFCGDRW